MDHNKYQFQLGNIINNLLKVDALPVLAPWGSRLTAHGPQLLWDYLIEFDIIKARVRRNISLVEKEIGVPACRTCPLGVRLIES